ncbi:MAG: YadA-like family protein [Veillonellaceae bacterium]|nr:YadA-like family protein [Veillonellaceae bacterium]
MNKKQWLTMCVGAVLLGNATAMASPMMAEEVDAKVEALIPRVTAVEGKLESKADKAELQDMKKSLVEEMQTNRGGVEENKKEIDGLKDTKADKSAVEELEDRVDTHGLAIKALKGNKADKAETEAALGELKEGLNNEVKDRKANEKALTKDIQTNRNAIDENRTAIGANSTAIGENRTAIGKVRDDLAGYQAAQKKVDAVQDARLVSEVNRLDTRIDRVGALTGALAGLKPIQYDPAAPTQVMAAVSTYEGKQGFALGVAHYAKENLMFHAGAAYDGDDKYMGNLGVTVKVGAGSSVADRYSMQRENAELREQLNAQERRIAELERMMMSVAR